VGGRESGRGNARRKEGPSGGVRSRPRAAPPARRGVGSDPHHRACLPGRRVRDGHGHQGARILESVEEAARATGREGGGRARGFTGRRPAPLRPRRARNARFRKEREADPRQPGARRGSGGYWISMPATTISTSPFTLTGSIGVIGGWAWNQGLGASWGSHPTTCRWGRAPI